MPNQIYATEWINFAQRNLETARILYKEDHYTDIIAVEIHQAVEKSFSVSTAF